MTKEKIKELLLSKDRELRLLGLSYLNEDKKSSNLRINPNYKVSLSANNPSSFSILFKDVYTIITTWNYNELYEKSLIDDFSKMLTPYINYCYK